MALPVDYSVQGDIALITVDNAPVNALSNAVREGLIEAVQRAAGDARVAAVVLRCAGPTFIGGADLKEFERPPQPPLLPEVVHAFEQSPKPVIATIHGAALGGGFEIALACHYRIAAADAEVGLPEVKIGVMPGAGGTQRLPRLTGFEPALAMITTGEPIPARRALELGAVDEIAEGDLERATIALARRVIDSRQPLRRVSELAVPACDPQVFAAAGQALAKKQPAFVAPRHVIEALRASTELPFAEALKRERELFLELRASPQAAALRHAFLGEREVGEIPDLPAGTPTREIAQSAVIGAGTMGVGIAMCFANAGIPVRLLEAHADALERGLQAIRKNYAATLARGGLTQAQLDERLRLIRPTLAYDELANADLIVEAVFEDIAVKEHVFRRVDEIAKPGAILATNTSYLDVAAIAEFTRRPQDVVGMHFFSPANVMKLLENVRGPKTVPDVLATVMKLGKRLGKVAVLVGGADGFVGNRMLAQRTREAWFLLEEGALPRQVDRALTDFGFPMGPFAVSDLAGLDIGWRNRKARAHLHKPGVRDCNLLDQVCELGRLGQKTGAGWYRYEPGGRAPIPDPQIEQLIVEHSRERGIERRQIKDEEIVERCVYSMINEAAKILAESVAARPVDIDMVWLHGYGFPRWRGGPLFYADQVGLRDVLDAVVGYRERFGPDLWTPAPLLEELARAGKGFYPSGRTSPVIVC